MDIIWVLYNDQYTDIDHRLIYVNNSLYIFISLPTKNPENTTDIKFMKKPLLFSLKYIYEKL